KSAQIREILISESAWEEMTCLFAPSLALLSGCISDTQKFLIQYSFDWYLFVTQLYFFAR
ncbi:hypothetical protein AB2904_13660, partial [Escherichia coli]